MTRRRIGFACGQITEALGLISDTINLDWPRGNALTYALKEFDGTASSADRL